MTDEPETEEEPEVIEKKELAPIEAGGGIQAIAPRSFEEVQRIANILVASGTVPYQLTNSKLPHEVVATLSVIIMQGLEVGFGPMLAMNNIAVINNKPTIWGKGAVALLQNSGTLKSYEIEYIGTEPTSNELKDWDDSYGCRVTLERNKQDKPYIGEFTVADAKRAKLWLNPKKDPWLKYPKRMLKWRAFGFASGDGFSDCLAGMAIAEEVQDTPMQEVEKEVETDFLDDEPVELIEQETEEADD